MLINIIKDLLINYKINLRICFRNKNLKMQKKFNLKFLLILTKENFFYIFFNISILYFLILVIF